MHSHTELTIPNPIEEQNPFATNATALALFNESISTVGLQRQSSGFGPTCYRHSLFSSYVVLFPLSLPTRSQHRLLCFESSNSYWLLQSPLLQVLPNRANCLPSIHQLSQTLTPTFCFELLSSRNSTSKLYIYSVPSLPFVIWIEHLPVLAQLITACQQISDELPCVFHEAVNSYPHHYYQTVKGIIPTIVQLIVTVSISYDEIICRC